MRTSAYIIAITVLVPMFLVAANSAMAFTVVGDKVGLATATVATGDSDRGLTVRAGPSAASAPKGYLPVGTQVKGNAQFRNGYMKIVSPVSGVWVRMQNLSPLGGEATVALVDKPDLCLRIRSGPGTGYDKVGCAELASKLQLTGVWTSDNWAQVEAPVKGWVLASQITSDLKPLKTTTTVATPQWSEPATSTVWREPRRRHRGRYWEDDDYYYNPYWKHGQHWKWKKGKKK
jgi:uncharacterized protein YraI